MSETSCLVVLVLLFSVWGCGDDDNGGGGGSDAGTADTSSDGVVSGADDLAKAAALWGSCIPDDGIAAAARHMLYPWELWDDVLSMDSVVACLAAATDGCEATARCAHVEAEIISGTCDSSCSADGVWVACDDSLQFTVDCSALGRVCDVEEGCLSGAVETCTDTDTSSCGTDGTPAYCDFDGNLQPGPDCDSFDLTCADYEGSSVCQGQAGACTPDGYGPLSLAHQGVGCSGDVLSACVNGGIREVDCSALGGGMSCQEADGDFFCGLADECTPYFGGDVLSCDGTTVEFCYLGRRESLDCTSLGFTGCDVTTFLGCTPVLGG